MKMCGRFLSDEEKLLIHNESIRILNETGVRFPSERVLAMLERDGAQIDWDRQVAFISADMVRRALAASPKSFVLGARNPVYDLRLPSSSTVYNLDGCGVKTLDYRTGIRRPAVLKDVAEAAMVFEEMDLGRVHWSPVSPHDVPAEAAGLSATAVSFMHTSKHVQDEVQDPAEVPYIIEMARAILGDMDSVRNRKIYSVTYCTVAPLSHDADMLEGTMDLAGYGVPVLVYPMPACGTTGPASLYSNVAMANAEALSAVVAFQLAAPGTPLIYGSALGVVNVRSGLFLEGTPETMLQIGAMGEMARYYGLPCMSAGCLSDAKLPGMQSVLEKTLTTLPLVLSGVDVVQGIGLIESSMTLSLPHIVIDNEIGRLCARIRQGIDVSEEKNHYDDIIEVGQGGHFLKQKSTRKVFRSDEFYQSELCDRSSYDEWEQLGRPDMIEKASGKVDAILNSEMKCPLPKDVEKALREITEEAGRKLGEKERR